MICIISCILYNSYIIFTSIIDKCATLNIAHGTLSSSDTSVGSTVTVTCEEGYHLNGESNLVCLESNEWSVTKPTCDLGTVLHVPVLY